MNERQELLEALDDISGALDDMRGTESVLFDYLKRHRKDGRMDDYDGSRYRAIKAIYDSVADVMGHEDDVSTILDDLSEELEGGR
jgi:hypothetical protein